MRIKDLLLYKLAPATAIGVCCGSQTLDGVIRRGTHIVVAQGTPGDGLVHKTVRLTDDSPDSDGTERAAPPRAWEIYLTGESSFAGDTNGDTGGVISPTVIWAKTSTGGVELVYARFDRGSWSALRSVSGDDSGELATRWWQNSLLTFVQGAPGSIEPDGTVMSTPGNVDPQLPTIRIDTAEDGDPSPITRSSWTVFTDDSILVLPFSSDLRDGAPTLGTTRVGDTIIPTVAWAHALSAGNHDPVVARFVNGAWTPAESIAINILEDLHPCIAQDGVRTVHATWERVASDGSLDGGVFYANEPLDSATFSAEERVSRSGEKALNPSIGVLTSGDVFIAYEMRQSDSMTRVIVSRRVQGQNGAGYVFRHRVAARTSGEVPADPELSSLEGERLLLTWVEYPSRVGFAIFSSGRWSTTGYEPIGSSETAGETRRRIAISLQGGEETDPGASKRLIRF